MTADVALCVHRDPDFFALSRLEGERWRVGVVEDGQGSLAGSIGVAERWAYLAGAATRTVYISDLKVRPEFRGRGVADALTEFAREAAGEVDPQAPTLLAALAGNAGIERRAPGPRGLPRLTHFATVRLHSIPLIGRRRPRGVAGLTVRRADDADIEEMAELWARTSPFRQFAPVLDASTFARLIGDAPGLDMSSYWIARHRSGRIAGFLALWDQRTFKQTLVLRYPRRLAIFLKVYHAIAPLVRGPRLPLPGEALRSLNGYQLCASQPDALRAILAAAYDEYRGGPYPLLTIGLDVKDPLSRALHGLWAQPTDILAYVTTPAGGYDGPPLGGRPLHFETALV
jgi:ribosomal protein S18 acetylase RimI-like enzyme